MAFGVGVTSEQLESLLKKGLYSEIETAVANHFIAIAQSKFDAEIKPIIKEKVKAVVQQLTKVTTAIQHDHISGNVVVQVEIR